jgi:iron-sulfur-dependent L-serine dehydratase beta subunit
MHDGESVVREARGPSESMKPISILGDVLGPVMRGPSSSHTAAPFHIGRLARALLGDEPAVATFTFDPAGSWAEVYHQQGSDLGFAAGLMGWDITDERFPQALDLAAAWGLQITFAIDSLAEADHPNTVEIRLTSRSGRTLLAEARSIGGGAVVFRRLDEWHVHVTGDAYAVLADAPHWRRMSKPVWKRCPASAVSGRHRLCSSHGVARRCFPALPRWSPWLKKGIAHWGKSR